MRRPNDVERRALVSGRVRNSIKAQELYEGLLPEREPVIERSLGDILREIRQLSDDQIERIVEHQRRHRVRFGEAAVALRLASGDEVLWALSQQFHYPYARAGGRELSGDLVMAADPFGEQAEAFRELRTQLLVEREAPHCAFAVVSPERGDGRSCVAANLAIAFSQLGARTLLMDADMRSPAQHRLFGVQGRLGLSGILAGHASSSVIQTVPGLPSLFVLAVGTEPPNPLELLQGPGLAGLMERVLARFDHVVVDTPAASRGADWRVAAASCGAAIMVARRGRSRLDDLGRMNAALRGAKVRRAGVVMHEF